MGINVIGRIIVGNAAVFAAAFIFVCCSNLFAQQRVAPYESVDFELNSSASKPFFFEASQGDVVEFTLAHSSTSLKATVFTPKGKKLFSITSPTLFTGTLPVSFRASESGVFKMTLETERPGKTVGQVQLNYISKRPYRSDDEDRLKAFTLISDAQEIIQSFYKLTADRSRKETVRNNLTDAVALCEKAKDRRCIAMASLEFGQFAFDEFSDLALAENLFRRAITEYSAVSDISGVALAKSRMALIIAFARGRDPEVMVLLDDAVASAKNIKDPLLESRTLMFQGRILRDWGEGGKGLELEKRAIALAGDQDLEGRFRALVYATSIAGLLFEKTYDVFLDDVYDAFTHVEGRMHPALFPWVLNSKAASAADRGDSKTFEALSNKLIAVAEAVGQKRSTALYLYSVGTVYLNIKKPYKARPLLERSLKLYEEVSPREAQAIYSSIGRFYSDTGNYLKAREYCRKAVELNEANGDKFAGMTSLNYLTDIELKLNNLDEAYNTAEKSYNYAMLLRGNYLTAVTQNGFEIGILREAAERMITVLYRLYERSPSTEYLDRALEIQELSISRSLFNKVRESGFDVETAVDPALIKKISEIQTQISETEIKLQGTPKDKQDLQKTLKRLLVEYEEIQEQIRKLNPNSALFNEPVRVNEASIRDLLDQDTVLVQYSVKFNESHVWILSKAGSDFRRIANKDEINSASNNFARDISDYSAKTEIKGQLSGQRLFNLIIKPILSDITKFKRVLIVPDEDLVAAPFAAIPIGINERGKQIALAEKFEIGILPSVSTLIFLRAARKEFASTAKEDLLAILADPVFDTADDRLKKLKLPVNATRDDSISQTLSGTKIKALNRLPFTSVEARQISELAPERTSIFSGLQAKRETVLSGDLSKYRIIHFATHGFLNRTNPELSSLALSMYDESGRSKNGFLRAIDIYSLRLKADLVVLGGCQTAGTAVVRGDGLAGLTRGFMYAGVPTVMASLWKVDDSATSYFMRYFYEALLIKGMTPPAALRDAQMRFINSSRWSSPRYWAAFTVQGEYQTTFKE